MNTLSPPNSNKKNQRIAPKKTVVTPGHAKLAACACPPDEPCHRAEWTRNLNVEKGTVEDLSAYRSSQPSPGRLRISIVNHFSGFHIYPDRNAAIEMQRAAVRKSTASQAVARRHHIRQMW
jgi:hypothetical protein